MFERWWGETGDRVGLHRDVRGCSGLRGRFIEVIDGDGHGVLVVSAFIKRRCSWPITIPDVVGQNAEIVHTNLERLGLTNVSLASANPKYAVVVLARNWTVVSIEPPAGTIVKADDPVVVKVTKD